MNTPWGRADHQKTIAPGIISVSTPSHGGYWVSMELVHQMPKTLRLKKPFAGEQWYEEDCDWAIVVLAFPFHFSENERYFAWRVTRPNPDFSAFYETDRGRAFHHDAVSFQSVFGKRFSLGSMGGSGNGWSVMARSLDGTRTITFTTDDYPSLPQIFTEEEARAIATTFDGQVVEQNRKEVA